MDALQQLEAEDLAMIGMGAEEQARFYAKLREARRQIERQRQTDRDRAAAAALAVGAPADVEVDLEAEVGAGHSTQVLVAARSPPIPIGAHEQALRTQSRQAAGDDDSQALQSQYHERATEIANLERRASALQQQLQQQRQILQLRQQQEEQKRVPQQRAVQRSV